MNSQTLFIFVILAFTLYSPAIAFASTYGINSVISGSLQVQGTTTLNGLSMSGGITISDPNSFNMSASSGVFSTGSGSVFLNGDTTIATNKHLIFIGNGFSTSFIGSPSASANASYILPPALPAADGYILSGAQSTGALSWINPNTVFDATVCRSYGPTSGSSACTITVGGTGSYNGVQTVNIGSQNAVGAGDILNIGTAATSGIAPTLNLGSSIGGSITLNAHATIAQGKTLYISASDSTNKIGISGPSSVTSYTVSLPNIAPSSSYVLGATSASALAWLNPFGGSAACPKFGQVGGCNSGTVNEIFIGQASAGNTDTINIAHTIVGGVATVNIANAVAGGTANVNIATATTGSASSAIIIGNTAAAASSISLKAGSTNGIKLISTNIAIADGLTGPSIKIGTASTSTTSVDIATGAGTTSSVNIGTSAATASTIMIGSTAGTGTTTINAGSGNIQLAADTVLGSSKKLYFTDSTTNKISFSAPSPTTPYDLVLPNAAPSSGNVLGATSASALTWLNPFGGSAACPKFGQAAGCNSGSVNEIFIGQASSANTDTINIAHTVTSGTATVNIANAVAGGTANVNIATAISTGSSAVIIGSTSAGSAVTIQSGNTNGIKLSSTKVLIADTLTAPSVKIGTTSTTSTSVDIATGSSGTSAVNIGTTATTSSTIVIGTLVGTSQTTINGGISGTGGIFLQADTTVGTTAAQRLLKFSGTSGTISFKAPSLTVSGSYTLPQTAPSVTSSYLVSSTTGDLSWAPAPSAVYLAVLSVTGSCTRVGPSSGTYSAGLGGCAGSVSATNTAFTSMSVTGGITYATGRTYQVTAYINYGTGSSSCVSTALITNNGGSSLTSATIISGSNIGLPGPNTGTGPYSISLITFTFSASAAGTLQVYFLSGGGCTGSNGMTLSTAQIAVTST